MNRKIIAYDLKEGTPEDYKDLYTYIEESLNGVRVNESVFICFSNLSNKEIRDNLTAKLKNMNKISIIVGDLPRGVYCYNTSNNEKWLFN